MSGRARAETAPDGSEVRPLARLAGGSLAQFTLAAGRASRAVAHRTVEEIWYVVEGRGEIWRKLGAMEETVALEPGACVTIPAGAAFQFRAGNEGALRIIGVTMPPWPGDGEAVTVQGPWKPSV